MSGTEAPVYTWSGWEVGEDVTPPEPGKEWLTIYEDGEEYAVIVLRTAASIFLGRPELLERARAMRVERAERIVAALNDTDDGS